MVSVRRCIRNARHDLVLAPLATPSIGASYPSTFVRSRSEILQGLHLCTSEYNGCLLSGVFVLHCHWQTLRMATALFLIPHLKGNNEKMVINKTEHSFKTWAALPISCPLLSRDEGIPTWQHADTWGYRWGDDARSRLFVGRRRCCAAGVGSFRESAPESY